MKYNLKIGNRRYSSKTLKECINIIGMYHKEITAACITPAARILLEVSSIREDLQRLVYYNQSGKVFLSINKRA